MGGVFNEQIVKRKPTGMDFIKRVGLVLAVLVVAFFSFEYLGFFAPIVVMIAGFGAWFVMGFMKVEYEYAFTDGELDIDIIYNRSRRKRVFSARVGDIEVMAHVSDKMREAEFSGAAETHDYTSGDVGPDTYAFLINYKGKRTKIIMEPNDKMLKAMATVLTRRRLHVMM